MEMGNDIGFQNILEARDFVLDVRLCVCVCMCVNLSLC